MSEKSFSVRPRFLEPFDLDALDGFALTFLAADDFLACFRDLSVGMVQVLLSL
jgi:hypothetical protein